MTTTTRQPVLQARGLVKRYGRVTAIASGDLELYPGEILGLIGDNGAGKTSLIKALCGALIPDAGEIFLEGQQVHFRNPMDARRAGIETVYQTLAVSPGLDIAGNLFLGREERKPGILGTVFRKLDHKGMRSEAQRYMSELGISTLQNIRQAVESLSGGQRQAVAVARSAAYGSKVTRLRGRRPDPHPAARATRHSDHAAVAHDGRGGGDHDRCDGSAPSGGLGRSRESSRSTSQFGATSRRTGEVVTTEGVPAP
jgi:fructose transport system ATP-binding protein